MNLEDRYLSLGIGTCLALTFGGAQVTLALPPSEDIPEEVLRTEIILEARSPIDGEELTAAEYAELEAQMAESPYPPELDSKIRHQIFLLRILKLINSINPL